MSEQAVPAQASSVPWRVQLCLLLLRIWCGGLFLLVGLFILLEPAPVEYVTRTSIKGTKSFQTELEVAVWYYRSRGGIVSAKYERLVSAAFSRYPLPVTRGVGCVHVLIGILLLAGVTLRGSSALGVLATFGWLLLTAGLGLAHYGFQLLLALCLVCLGICAPEQPLRLTASRW